MNWREIKEKIVGKIEEIVKKTYVDPTPKRLILEIRKILCDFDAEWDYIE